MSEQGLDHPDVDSLLDQQRRGGVPESVRGQVWFDAEAPRQGPQPLTERGRAEPATFRVQEQGRRNRAFFRTRLAKALKILLQLTVRHEDDPLLVAFAIYEDLAAVRRNLADPYIGQLADPQRGQNQQLDDQDRYGILRDRYRIFRAWLRSHSHWAFASLENHSEGVPIDGTRQAARDLNGGTNVCERRGQGAVSIFAPGKVRFEGHETPLDGRGSGVQIVAQVPVVGEDVVSRQRIGELMRSGEAREGA